MLPVPTRCHRVSSRRERRLASALACLLLVAATSCAQTAPILEVRAAPIAPVLPIEEVAARVERAARMQNWRVERASPGELIVSKPRGHHRAISAIRFEAKRFSIDIVASDSLNQSDGQIHPLYNEWVRALETTIQHEIRSAKRSGEAKP